MQVALNSGQFMASGAKRDFYNSLKDFDYYQSRLYRLQTYILEDDIKKISYHISESSSEKIEAYLK